MDGWTMKHWIEIIDAISPEEDRHGRLTKQAAAHHKSINFGGPIYIKYTSIKCYQKSGIIINEVHVC